MSQSHVPHHICPPGLAPWLDNRLRRWLHKPNKLFGDLVKPGYTVFDIGCATGTFTLALADLTGEEGCVVAIDLQEEMLHGLAEKLRGSPLEGRIRLHQAREDTLALGAEVQADFSLMFWMLHEVPDMQRILRETLEHTRSGGRLLLVEPVGEVGSGTFADELRIAEAAGWRRAGKRRIALSQAELLEKP